MMSNLERFTKNNLLRSADTQENMMEYIHRKAMSYAKTISVTTRDAHLSVYERINGDYGLPHDIAVGRCGYIFTRVKVNDENVCLVSLFEPERKALAILYNPTMGPLKISACQIASSGIKTKPNIEATRVCDRVDPHCPEVLEWIPSHILAPDRISIQYHDWILADPFAIFASNVMVTFFPDNYPIGGVPIVLSRESIAAFCHERFARSSSNIFILDKITRINETVATLIEFILDPAVVERRDDVGIPYYYPGMRKMIDAMAADDLRAVITILHYLGMSWIVKDRGCHA